MITDVPLVGQGQPLPRKLVCRVFVSGGHAGSLRAANYAQTLGIKDTRAVSFAFDGAEAQRMQFEWGGPRHRPAAFVGGWRRALHNQRARYLKRLLLFEPRVILTSVPYQLG